MSVLPSSLIGMGIQDDAARSLVEALGRHHLGTTLRQGMVPSVSITEHPAAVVYFKVDQLGALLTEFVFDGRPPVRLQNSGTATDADALADHILNQIAGKGGRSLA